MVIFIFYRVKKMLVFVIIFEVLSLEFKMVYLKIRKFYIIFLNEKVGFKEYGSVIIF